MKKLSKLILPVILLLAAFLRIYQLNSIPVSLNWDEVSLGYNAYSIFKTGRDEWGNFLPFIFRAFGDYKLPLYIYLTAPIVGLFGLNTLTTRFVSIFAGIILPLIIYKILMLIYPKSKSLSLIGAFIFALAPWHIFLSRVALEANLFLTLFFISLYFLLKKNYSLSTVFYGLCLFTYNSSRALLPFYLLLVTFLMLKDRYNFKKHFILFLPIIFAVSLFLLQTFQPSGQARYSWVSLVDQGVVNQINEARNLSRLPPLLNKLINNRLTYFCQHFTQNYLDHFNPQFLFQNGGTQYQFSLPHFYLLQPLFIVFWIWGIFILIKNIRNTPYFILLFLFLVSPIPSSITRESPHVLRSLTFIALSQIIIFLPLFNIAQNYRKILSIIFLSISLLAFYQFVPRYQSYAVSYSSSWQYGYQQAIDFIKPLYPNYNQIIITKKYGEPHEFVLFYWPWSPQKYLTDPNLNWDYHADWYWVNAFDKFKFVNDWDIKSLTISKSTLLITSPGNYPQPNAKILYTVNFLDNTPAFDIISYDQ